MEFLITERLILRPFGLNDADDVYEYAKNEMVGPNAGWKPHESADESRQIIKDVFMPSMTWAIVYKDNNKVIGSISVSDKKSFELTDFKNLKNGELGYALSQDYWGLGIMTEASKKILDFCFNMQNYDVIFCGHFDYNIQSKKVILKNNFKFYNQYEKYYDAIKKNFTMHIYFLTKADYIKNNKG